MQESNNNFTAKKSLGQNFLHAPNVIGKMIHAARIGVEAGGEADEVVFEAGPGKGALTEKLIATGIQVIAIEKDDRAIDFLKEKFASSISTKQFTLIHGDVLEIEPKNIGLDGLNYIIAANIPYYITGEFLRKFLETSHPPKRMILMLQKEVAKRISVNTTVNSAPNREKESILSISVKAYGSPKYITTVPARFFRPIPNVDSALLYIDTISKDFFEANNIAISEKDFFNVVKTGFAHKRKVLIKNLESLLENTSDKQTVEAFKEKIRTLWQKKGFSPTIRAEELSLNDWKDITFALIPYMI